jgi:hypothetical protein
VGRYLRKRVCFADYLTGELQPYLDRATEAQAKLDPATELDRYRKLHIRWTTCRLIKHVKSRAHQARPAILASMAEMGELFLSRIPRFARATVRNHARNDARTRSAA